jgi:hypothetical protein
VAWSTVTVTVPLFEPLAGLTVSQLRDSVTAQDPLEVIDNDWLAGLALPWVAVKAKLEEPTVKVGEGAVTVNETGIDCGEFVAPVPATVIDELYVPAESPVTLAVTTSEPGPVPEAGETESHAAVLDAFQLKVPVPVLLMLTVCADGLVPPWLAEKFRLVGARPMVGISGAVSVRVAITVCGVLVAPVAAMVKGAV